MRQLSSEEAQRSGGGGRNKLRKGRVENEEASCELPVSYEGATSNEWAWRYNA